MHTMVFLQENGAKKASTREIAAALNRSEFHLSKVLQRLARAGFVRSARGPKGGFQISDKGREISLLDVYETFEGPLDETQCLMDTRFCRRGKCIMGGLIHSVNQQFKEYMGLKRIGDFLEN